MNMLTEKTVEKDGCVLHYWCGGNKDGAAVIFTHGMTMSHEMWQYNYDAVIDAGYRVIGWDMRGHGKSRPMGDDITVPRAASDILAILDNENIEQAVLVGHSMGGMVSQEFAFRYPERTKAVFILGSLCITSKQPAMVHAIRPLSKLFFWPCPMPLVSRFTKLFAGKKRQTKELARRICKVITKEDFKKIWNAILSCDHYEPGYKPEMPFMITRGDGDHWVGVGMVRLQSRRWARMFGCRHGVVPNAGHNACSDNPEAFNVILTKFLNSIHI